MECPPDILADEKFPSPFLDTIQAVLPDMTLMKYHIGRGVAGRAAQALTLPDINLIESERQLRMQGHRDSFIDGMDAMGEQLSLANALRQGSIDPGKTHIPKVAPNFAYMIDSRIRFIEEGIRLSDSSDRQERLEILGTFKAEVERVKAQEQLTYRYYVGLHYRLAILATPQEQRTKQKNRSILGGMRIQDIPVLRQFWIGDQHEWITHAALETTFQRFPRRHFDGQAQHLGHLLDLFPDIIVLPITYDAGIFPFNRLSNIGVHFLQLVNQPTDAHGQLSSPQWYWEHDVNHAIDMTQVLIDRTVNNARAIHRFQNALLYGKIQPLHGSLRERLEFIYFQINRETPELIDRVFNHLRNNQQDAAIDVINTLFRTDDIDELFLDPEDIEDIASSYRELLPFTPDHIQTQDEVLHFLQDSAREFVHLASQVPID